MKVVTCYRASKIAGVSKQAIQSLKNANTLQKGKYPFFCFDPETGKYGIDIENKEWLNYLDRNRTNPARRNKTEHDTKGQTKSVESSNNVDKDTLIDAVVTAINEVIKPSMPVLRKLLKRIEDIYEGKG